MLPVGTRVKKSEGALRSLRDSWLNAGTQDKKTLCKKWLTDAQAKRGTVIKSGRNSINSPQLDIQWDDGAISMTAPHLVAEAND